MTTNPFTAKALGKPVPKKKRKAPTPPKPKKKLKAFGASDKPVAKKPAKVDGTKKAKLRSFGTSGSDPRKRDLEAAENYANAAARKHAEASKVEAKAFKAVDKLEKVKGTDKYDAAKANWDKAMHEVDVTYANLHRAIVRERNVRREIEQES